MTARRRVPVLLLPLLAAACATHWREEASAIALNCPSSEVVTSDRTSGSINNTWHAQCGGKIYFCTVPADAEPSAPPSCQETGMAPAAERATSLPPPLPLPEKVVPPAPSAPTPPRAAPATAPAPPTSDLESKLQILKRAHDQGLITDAEYASKRQALLDAF